MLRATQPGKQSLAWPPSFDLIAPQSKSSDELCPSLKEDFATETANVGPSESAVSFAFTEGGRSASCETNGLHRAYRQHLRLGGGRITVHEQSRRILTSVALCLFVHFSEGTGRAVPIRRSPPSR